MIYGCENMLSKRTDRTLKGQAMMEYLMTYGLALLVILVVLAVLATVVLPSLKPPETCQFTQPGLSCNQKQHVIVTGGTGSTTGAAGTTGNVRVIFQLDNQFGRNIEINGILCSNLAPANIQRDSGLWTTLAQPLPVPAGGSRIIGGPDPQTGGQVITVSCGTTLAANSNFRGSLGIRYKYEDDVPGAPLRLAVATLGGNVQQG